MTRVVLICAVLAGCALPSDNVYDTHGKRLDVAYVVIAPLCLFICPVTVTTTGSDVDIIGQGASGASTQTPNVTTGAIN